MSRSRSHTVRSSTSVVSHCCATISLRSSLALLHISLPHDALRRLKFKFLIPRLSGRRHFIISNHKSRNRSRSLLQACYLNVANVACLIAAEAHRGMLWIGEFGWMSRWMGGQRWDALVREWDTSLKGRANYTA